MKNIWDKHKTFVHIICGVVVGFLNGFFGGGGGMVCVPMLQKFCGYQDKQSHATTLCVILPLSIVSSLVYIYKNDLDFVNLLLVTIGAMLGGILGAKILNKLSVKWVRVIFAIVMFLAGLKTIL